MSDFDDDLRALLKTVTAINDRSKDAINAINEFVNKDGSSKVTREQIITKLLDFTNDLQKEVIKTKDAHSKLTKSLPDKNGDLPLNVTEDINKSQFEVKGEATTREETSEADLKEKNKDTENGEVKRPMLKIVDFSKLVDPRNLELMDKNHRQKESNKNSSIIILSSSDDEILSDIRPTTTKVNKSVSYKTRSNNMKISKKPNILLKINSISVCETQKPKTYSSRTSKNYLEKSAKDKCEKFLQNDVKLRSKAVVNITRIPSNEMKSYLEKSSQIKKIASLALESHKNYKKASEPVLDEKTGEFLQGSESSSEEEALGSRLAKWKKKISEKSRKKENLPGEKGSENLISEEENNSKEKEFSTLNMSSEEITSKSIHENRKNTNVNDPIDSTDSLDGKSKTIESDSGSKIENIKNKSSKEQLTKCHSKLNKEANIKIVKEKSDEDEHSKNKRLRKKLSLKQTTEADSENNEKYSSDENASKGKGNKNVTMRNRNRKKVLNEKIKNLSNDENSKSVKSAEVEHNNMLPEEYSSEETSESKGKDKSEIKKKNSDEKDNSASEKNEEHKDEEDEELSKAEKKFQKSKNLKEKEKKCNEVNDLENESTHLINDHQDKKLSEVKKKNMKSRNLKSQLDISNEEQNFVNETNELEGQDKDEEDEVLSITEHEKVVSENLEEKLHDENDLEAETSVLNNEDKNQESSKAKKKVKPKNLQNELNNSDEENLDNESTQSKDEHVLNKGEERIVEENSREEKMNKQGNSSCEKLLKERELQVERKDKEAGKSKKNKNNDELSEEEDESGPETFSKKKRSKKINKKSEKTANLSEKEETDDSSSKGDLSKKKANSGKNKKSNSSDEEDTGRKEKPSSKKGKDQSDEDMFDTNNQENKVSSDEDKNKSLGKVDENLYVLSESEDEPTKKKKTLESSDSDIGKKRKRKENKYSEEEVININSDDSDDSDDFGTFCSKKATLGLRNKKKKVTKLDSDSEEEDKTSNKGKLSGSEYEGKNTGSGSSDSSVESDGKEQDKSSKRGRIKREDLDSSESDDGLRTRKKIKRLISKDSLSETTKKAAAEERERRQRILEKQKKYNQIYENINLASSKVEKLILDVDEKTGKPLVEVNNALVSKLKPHQASGVQFMWDACFESLERAKTSGGSGCILAHCMGLGKTLQVITLTNTLLEASEKTKVKTVLIVTPLSTVLNWKAEYTNWLSGDEEYEVFEMVSCKSQNAERSYCVQHWHENGGVMIMSYAMFRNLSNDKNKKISKKIRTRFIEGLVDPGPDLVICDEGHLLKNEKTSLSVAMNKIKTRRRIVLTGTPLQNNLKEYYCMVQFVKPNLLGTYREYLNRFVNPITNGQYTDSTQYDINIMRRRSHVLHKLLEGIVQRRDYSVLSPYLPPKFEFVLFLTLSEIQKKLYSHYLNNLARKSKDESSNKTSYLFQDFQAFSRICLHPRVLLDKSIDDQNKYQSDDEESIGSLKNFIADNSDSASTTPASSDSESGSGSGSDTKKKKKKKSIKRVTRAQKAAGKGVLESEEEEEESAKKEWWQEYCDGEELDNIAHGTKLMLLFEILKECEQIGDKVLVFSQSLYALNVIEYFLDKIDQATQNGDADEKTCGYTGSWTPGLDYFRLDGSTNCSLRSNWCDSFNKESNSRARLFLLSTRAGGLGINLVAANRVIIFDVSWNPSSDIQSIYRVYRFGQLKPSYIYRFVIYGTMEMKIYERQVIKQAISKRVIDEQQIDRHYNQNDLAELYKFETPGLEDRPVPLVPKDVLLGELLQHHEDKIFKYHEHQSLLENKEDETLNEEERKAAWDEFENEKVERTKPALIGKFAVSTVQLALRSIIQRDNPTWNNSQILSIIPQLIEQLNNQLAAGDSTMYNRIATEIRLMQEEYARKMQMQYQQYRLKMEAQRQQQLGLFTGQNPAMLPFQRFMFMNQPPQPNMPGPSRTLNPNEVVELN